VHPVLECIQDRHDGTFEAFFGYKNDDVIAVTIPVGPDNWFQPPPGDRGQTTYFLPGRVTFAFSVIFDGNDLAWTLRGPDGNIRTVTANRGSAPCEIEPPEECGDGEIGDGEECDDGNNEDGDGCSAECGIEVNIALGLQFCTLSQGGWGSADGPANGPDGFVTRNPDILPVTLGGPGQETTIGTQEALIAYLPKGGRPRALDPGERVFSSAADVVEDGGGSLAGQTLSLQLAVNLSERGATFPDLADLILPRVPFCTQGLWPGDDGVPGTEDDQLDPASPVTGPWHLASTVAVANNTVSDLLIIANQYLRGESNTATITEVNEAMDTLNKAFDNCRRVVECP